MRIADTVTSQSDEMVDAPIPDAKTPPRREEHRRYLDGVRGAAALFVVGHHLWLQSRLPFTLYGHFAVDLFIVLSGFCLTLPLLATEGKFSGGVLRYFVRRGVRILPPYYFCLLLSVWLVGLWRLESVSSHELWTHVFLVHDAYLGPDLAINSPMWTIAVEWRIYLAFPLLIVLARYWGAGPTALLALITSEILQLSLKGTWVNTSLHGVSPQYLTLFALGMLGANLVQGIERRSQNERSFGWFWLPILLGLTLVMLAGGKAAQRDARLWDYAVGLWAMALLIVVSIRPGVFLSRLFSFPPLAACGVMGYSIYLIHMPLVRGLEKLLPGFGISLSQMDSMTRFYWMAGIGYPFILFCSIGFYLVCERPFRLLSQRMRNLSWQGAPPPSPSTSSTLSAPTTPEVVSVAQPTPLSPSS
jgi:peptidoglycan/LPS O-acetylase OafA/YrhL